MTRILFYFKLIIISIVFFSNSAGAADNNKTIYIDPLFGGKETGAIFAHKYAAKVLTLDISQKIKVLLKAKGFPVLLSRENDSYVPLEERVAGSKINECGTYIAINMRQTNNDTVIIYYPEKEIDNSKKEEKELSGIIGHAIKQTKYKGSYRLAELVSLNLKASSVVIDIKVHPKKSFILDETFIPTIIIEVGVSVPSSRYIYVRDSDLIEMILNAIVKGVIEYRTESGTSVNK
jgi:N-acetylmuramoyl-L-alanine amidase